MLDSRIPLSVDRPANLLDAVSSGFQSAEAIRNAPLMRSLLEQRVQGGQQALQAGQQDLQIGQQNFQNKQYQFAQDRETEEGVFVNKLSKMLRSQPMDQRQAIISEFSDTIKKFGENPEELRYDDQSLDRAIAATNIFSSGSKPEESVIVKPGELLVGSQSGRQIAAGLASPEDDKEAQSKVNTLRTRVDKFNSDLRSVDVAFRKINTAPSTAAGDLSLIFNFMKMLDPGSTVREGEFANAQNAAGVPTRILNIYNQAKDGTRLSSEQRAEFRSAAKSAYNAQVSGADGQIAQVLQQADQDGVDRARVLGAKALRDFEKRAADSVISGSQSKEKRLIFNPSTGRLE